MAPINKAGLEGSSLSQTQFGRKAGSSTLTGEFVAPPLPYAMDALWPFISKENLKIHYEKFHKGNVTILNRLVRDRGDLRGKSLEGIILLTYHKGHPDEVFNYAAEVWNHQFFWESMKPNGGGKPTGELLEQINADFYNFDHFYTAFVSVASRQFGCGWAWVAYNPQKKKLEVLKTPNAENPLVLGYKPLLTVDVWEHAYYLDYEYRRPTYLSLMKNFVSWEAVDARFKAAKASSA